MANSKELVSAKVKILFPIEDSDYTEWKPMPHTKQEYHEIILCQLEDEFFYKVLPSGMLENVVLNKVKRYQMHMRNWHEVTTSFGLTFGLQIYGDERSVVFSNKVREILKHLGKYTNPSGKNESTSSPPPKSPSDQTPLRSQQEAKNNAETSPAPTDSEASWNCPNCNINNSAEATQCGSCTVARPKKFVLVLQIPDNVLNPERYQLVKINEKPPGVVTPALSPMKDEPPRFDHAEVESWKCICTLNNKAIDYACSACGRFRADAWQCPRCKKLLHMDVSFCPVCRIWRCHKCSSFNHPNNANCNVCLNSK